MKLRARVGSRPGASFKLKVVGGTSQLVCNVDQIDLRASVYDVEVVEFTRAAVRFTGKEMARLFILEPADAYAEYSYEGFCVAGYFQIVEKINNPRESSERWKSFA